MSSKSKGGRSTRATQSFAELVGKQQLAALKPYIDQQVELVAEHVVLPKMVTRLAVLSNQIETLKTILVQKLNVQRYDIDQVLFDLEDKVTGYERSSVPAQKGDLVRLSMRMKPKGQEYLEARDQEFSDLGNAPYALGIPDFENAILGMMEGELKVVPVPTDAAEASGVEAIEFTINRVSTKVVKEQPNVESSNAAQPVGSAETVEAQPQAGQ